MWFCMCRKDIGSAVLFGIDIFGAVLDHFYRSRTFHKLRKKIVLQKIIHSEQNVFLRLVQRLLLPQKINFTLSLTSFYLKNDLRTKLFLLIDKLIR